MIQINFYENGTGKYIKDWPNWSGEVPATGDVVTLHYGDDYEEERSYIVKLRVIDGTRPDRIRLFIEELPAAATVSPEDIDDLLEEMRKFYNK